MAGGGDKRQGDLLDTQQWLQDYGGAAPYWYVDPRAGKPPSKDSKTDLDADTHEAFYNLLDALTRIGYTPKGDQGNSATFGF